MTFDEIVYGLSGNDSNEKMTVSESIRLIEILRQEYAPTVEMTKTEKNNILSSIKYGSSFINFYTDVMHQSTAIKFGAQTNPELYKSFSEEKLMQAWLHPETIKIVDE